MKWFSAINLEENSVDVLTRYHVHFRCHVCFNSDEKILVEIVFSDLKLNCLSVKNNTTIITTVN